MPSAQRKGNKEAIARERERERERVNETEQKVVATASRSKRSCNWVADCISDDIQGKLGEVSTENDIKRHERAKGSK